MSGISPPPHPVHCACPSPSRFNARPEGVFDNEVALPDCALGRRAPRPPEEAIVGTIQRIPDYDQSKLPNFAAAHSSFATARVTF
jgi:hypothetical protein